MKLKIRSDDGSTQQGSEWLQMNHWLAELREDAQAKDDAEPGQGAAEPRDDATEPRPSATESRQDAIEPRQDAAEPRDDATEPRDDAAEPRDDATEPWPNAAQPRDDYREAGRPDAGPAELASGQARAATPAEPAVFASPARAPERAVIGDQLRVPIMWCEMGACISWHADRAALGEADARARAIGVGWRIDAFGRLACPRCQQTDPGFRTTRPVVPWDRYTAIARAARFAAVRTDRPVYMQVR